jgi:methionyl-tRNA synthetase
MKTALLRRGISSICQEKPTKSLITTPIFYVNGDPHVGQIYSAVLGDAAHRWTLLKAGKDADLSKFKLTTGVDEHGAKVQSAASLAGVEPQQYVDQNSAKFQEAFQKFGILNTDFIRTTDERHKKAVTSLWDTLKSNGHIEKANFEGWYSPNDECFYTEKEVEKVNIDDGVEVMISKETKNPVEFITEENYMFNIGNFQQPIRDWLNSGALRPNNFLPSALTSLRSNEKLSVSRDAKKVSWGIPVPGDSSQTVYIWMDALVSYLTAAGYPNQSSKDLLPPDVQIIGKDILKFHAVYWPAFLLAADLPLPKKIFVHSNWLINGQKMSQSYGNALDAEDASEVLTCEGLRYFFLRQGKPHDDGNFTMNKAVNLVNAELGKSLGNLLNRCSVPTLNPKQRYPAFDVEVMEHELKATGEKLVRDLNSLNDKVSKCYDDLLFYRGIEHIFDQVRNTNAFFEIHQPWKMKKGADLSTILFLTYETVRVASLLLQPVVPEYADKALSRLGLSKDERTLETAKFGGGPSLQLYGRNLGENQGHIIDKLERDDETAAETESGDLPNEGNKRASG